MTEQPPGPPSGGYPPPGPPSGGYPPPPPPQGGGFPPPPGYGTQPNNNLVWAILVTVFCCLPLGIVSIVKATQVSGLWAQGQYAEAQTAADDARKWAMWGAIIGGVIIVIAVIINVAAMSSTPS
jgi:uncharacterized membrane protein